MTIYIAHTIQIAVTACPLGVENNANFFNADQTLPQIIVFYTH